MHFVSGGRDKCLNCLNFDLGGLVGLERKTNIPHSKKALTSEDSFISRKSINPPKSKFRQTYFSFQAWVSCTVLFYQTIYTGSLL